MNDGPFITVILPCLNEEASITEAVQECRRGLQIAGLRGEVLVSDNGSTDASAELAAAAGARVIRSSPQGYGAAYLAALTKARGDIIVMGDADLTYPMERLGEFVELAKTNDLVIGSRFEGPNGGANIPFLNRYVGNPLLSYISRALFGGRVQDFHCGMRAVRRDALPALDLHTPGMEFASEMIVKALRAGLTIAEIPIEYRERVGESKLNRWRDGWRHLRFLFCHAPDTVLLYPGLALAAFGLLANLAFVFGDVTLLRTWGLHSHAAALGCLLIGLQGFSLGVLARHFSALLMGEKGGVVGRLVRGFSLETGVLTGAATALVGILLGAVVIVVWGNTGFGALDEEHLALTAVAITTAGVQLVLVSFFAGILDLQHARVAVQAREDEPDHRWVPPAGVSS
jgi:glycosyltransferase involved in cell wall biosynthesis